MAEVGPSSSGTQHTSTSATPPPSSPQPQRSTRIRFPAEPGPSRLRDHAQSLGLGPPPAIRQSGNQGDSLSFQQDDKRRRVKSVDASNGFDSLRSRDNHSPSPLRTTSFSRKAEQREVSVELPLADAFSDEFDLYPGVLEDVQRALRLKVRREARLRIQSSPLRADPLGASDIASLSSVDSSASGVAPPFPRQTRISGDSEIDFSPSVSVNPLYPVPSSSDDGLTLDWTTPSLEDGRDRRWSLSRSKRKFKEPSSNKAVIKKQEIAYANKLAHIQSMAAPLTQRKVEMIRDQLQRKYRLLSSNGKLPVVNLLDVTRWYRKQDAHVRANLDKEEPSTWMKHLWDKHSLPRAGNSTWSPTALVMEEYVKMHANSHMDSIPENEVTKAATAKATYSDTLSPSDSSYSWTTPRHSLDAAISRKKSSYDAQVSFEPLVESGRDSVGGDSRRSSEHRYRGHKTTGPGSAHSSLYSVFSKGGSPNNSRNRLRDLGKRLVPRRSDEALSSARTSISEHSGQSVSDEGGHHGHQKMATVRPHSRPRSLQLQGSPWLSHDGRPSVDGTPNLHTPEAPTTATQKGTLFPTAEPTPRPETSLEHSISQTPLPRRRFRRSLPSLNGIVRREGAKHRRSANEQKEREEYEIKAQVLEDTLSQNYRIRHLLQRVSASIREYDSVQGGLSNLLGTPYTKIPVDILDAFMHDPSAVTGGTRRAKSWRAVEDIHNRIERQRQTLQAFVHSQLLDGSLTPPHHVFDDPIAKLMHALEELASEREELVHRAQEVATVLQQVKTVQADVKKDYNDTYAHTSLVYPELSQTSALEENYRNQYQRFWDIGLDALTLLLDTVTPFWRNYGKVIGEDVQDFLIVPWYRNEFTGEPKRYPIKQFPRRSLRHWIGLLFLGCLSVLVTVLQVRAAISLSVHINMPWIDHTGLWWIVFPLYIILLIIQWCAVLLEICILLTQCGIVIWWMGWSVNLFT